MTNPTRTAVVDPQHVQDENGDLVGYVRGSGVIAYTSPYGRTVAASRTLVNADLEQVLDVSAAATITVPADNLLGITDATARRTVATYQSGAGAAAFAAGAGVTLRGTPPAAARYLTVGLMHVGLNEWAYL